MSIFAFIGGIILRSLQELGQIMFLLGSTLRWMVRPPYRFDQLLKQLEFIGVDSISVIGLTGLFCGAVMALQSSFAFGLFDANSMIGPTVALVTMRELGPVFTTLMVSARCGSAMAAEIGTMRVTEQIDALDVMAVDPVQYLIAPRLLASFIMLPALTVIFDFVALVGSAFVTVSLLDIPLRQFYENTVEFVALSNFTNGLYKSAVFGIIVAIVSCYKGFYTTGGAAGVGKATTASVVMAAVTTLIVDYFLTAILF